MTASGDDQPTRQRRRPVLTGVLAVIGAVVFAVFLSGCRGPSTGPGPAASSPSAAPSTGPTYEVTATVPAGKDPAAVAVDPGTHTNLFNNSQVIRVCSHDHRAPIRDRPPHTCRP
jgi:hypothetical protein